MTHFVSYVYDGNPYSRTEEQVLEVSRHRQVWMATVLRPLFVGKARRCADTVGVQKTYQGC